MVGAYIRLYAKEFRGKYKFLFGFCFSYFMIVVLTLFIKFLSSQPGTFVLYCNKVINQPDYIRLLH